VHASTAEVAAGFTALWLAGGFFAAGEQCWAEDVLSIEPRALPDGTPAKCSGIVAVRAKNLAWFATHGIEDLCKGWIGVDHLAWTLGSLDELFENYSHCRSHGIEPYWCVHHGVTISMYYADPDGNQMEFQVNAFDSVQECNAYIRGNAFASNPVGVEFDPDAWLAAVRGGSSLDDFRTRKIHEPVSPIRGAVGALL